MRIFLDCTETYFSKHNTGIQRVVRNIANEARGLSNHNRWECIPVIRSRRGYRMIHEIPNPAERRRSRVCDFAMYRKLTEIVCRLLPLVVVRKWLQPPAGHRGVFHLPARLCRQTRYLKSSMLPNIRMERGDVLVLLDLGMKLNWTEIDELRDRGVTVGGVVYDLEPVRNPQFCTAKTHKRFPEWLKSIGSRYDFAVTISETVRQHLVKHFEGNTIATRLTLDRVAAFRLGSNLDGSKDGTPQIRAEVRDPLQQTCRPTILTVGTIEPRKNHKGLLDAFDAALARGADFRCVIAGAVGWKCDDLVQRIQSHPELGRRLLVFHDLTDDELQFAYSKADCFVYPTHAEGYGLPLTEAMGAGLPVIANDIPILRETSGNSGLFVSTADPAELTDALVQFSRGELAIPQPDNCSQAVISWRDSTAEFLNRVAVLAANQPDETTSARVLERSA